MVWEKVNRTNLLIGECVHTCESVDPADLRQRWNLPLCSSGRVLSALPLDQPLALVLEPV